MEIVFNPANADECAMVADIVEAVLNGRKSPETPAPAKKAAKKAAAPVVEAVVEEVVEEETVESVTETVTRKDTVDLATKLVADGRAADVKGVLAKYNAAKVSLVAEEDLASFYVALSAL